MRTTKKETEDARKERLALLDALDGYADRDRETGLDEYDHAAIREIRQRLAEIERGGAR